MYFSSPNIGSMFSSAANNLGQLPANSQVFGVTDPNAEGLSMSDYMRQEIAAGRHKSRAGKSGLGRAKSYFKRAGNKVEDYGKRAKKQTIEGYRRYKDPIIVGGATALGALLGSVVPGVGTLAGAAAGGSLAGGAVGYHNQKKAASAQKAASDDFLNYFGGGKRLKSYRRQGGEGDVSYSTEEYV